MIEPNLANFPNPVAKYIAATRPPFLSVTLVGCLLGLATAHASGIPLDAGKALLTIFFALVAHAGVNVVNDYYDALSGADAANTQRLFPFTGGSRFIQNELIGQREMGLFGYALLASVIPPGLWLAFHSSPGLLLIGLAGLFIGWAYSAPPLQLMSRGIGELAIVSAWLLVTLGSDYVQRGSFSPFPLLACLPFALLVANILYINQFPDRLGDAAAGKKTVVVRLGAEQARWGYLLIAVLAHGWLLYQVAVDHLPGIAALSAATLPLSLRAAGDLLRHAGQPSALAPAIKLTILAANLQGLLLTLMLACALPLTGNLHP